MTIDLIISLIVFILIFITNYILPALSKPYLLFGVTVPRALKKEQELKDIVKSYHLTIIVGTAFAFSIMLFMLFTPLGSPVSNILVPLSIQFIFGLIAYLVAYKKTKIVALAHMSDFLSENRVIIDSTFHTKIKVISSLWFILYLLITLLTLIIGAIYLPKLPQVLAVHFDQNMNPNGYMDKNIAILSVPVIQLFITLVFYIGHISISHSKQELDPLEPLESSKRNVIFRYRMSIILYLLGLSILATMLMTQLGILGIIQNLFLAMLLPMLLIFPIVFIMVGLIYKYGQGGWRIKEKADSPALKVNSPKDDRYWKLGIFYYNTKDPSLWIEKRVGAGWTLNMANPLSWLFILFIIGLIIFSITISL